jgi:ribosomal protein L29
VPLQQKKVQRQIMVKLKMKFKALAQLSRSERQAKLKELELELIKLNSQVATGTPPKNAGDVKRIKKDMARIMLLDSIEEKISMQQKQKTTEKIAGAKEGTAKKQVKAQNKVQDKKSNQKTDKNQNE